MRCHQRAYLAGVQRQAAKQGAKPLQAVPSLTADERNKDAREATVRKLDGSNLRGIGKQQDLPRLEPDLPPARQRKQQPAAAAVQRFKVRMCGAGGKALRRRAVKIADAHAGHGGGPADMAGRKPGIR